MNQMNSCDEVRHFLIYHLERDIEAHERGDFEAIAQDEYSCPSLEGCADVDTEEEERLLTALEFWDGWKDARNHNWAYYPGVQRDDWPLLARQICLALRESWDVGRMRDNPVFDRPFEPTKDSWWKRLFCK